MFHDFYHAFYYLALSVSVIVGIVLFSKIETAYKWIALLMLITLFSELIARFVGGYLHETNNIVYHFFTPVEFMLYCIIYRWFFKERFWNAVLFISFMVLLILELLNTLFFQPLQTTNTNIMIGESVLLVLISLSLFTKIMVLPVYDNILSEGVFWFNSAVLLFYSFNILVWGFHSIKVYQLQHPPTIIYDLILLFSGLLYLFFALAVTLNYQSKRKPVQPYE